MKFATHYKTAGGLACSQRVGMSGRGTGSARCWTDNKAEVTCTKCLNQIAKWERK